MIFEIDNREPTKIKEYFGNSNTSNTSNTLRFKNLEQGDFIIRDSEENIQLLFERKTIEDLLASVKDSRYSEQSERYSQLDLPNSKIYYIIEGNLNNLPEGSTEYKTVYSCIFSLSVKKKFSVLLSTNVNNTITLLQELLIRISNDKDKSSTGTSTLVKKQTVSKDNIDSYMLNLVPGIGLNTAKEILTHFDGKIYNLMCQLRNGNGNESIHELLNGIKIKSRKLSKKIVQSIKEYL
jgi:ERCC4-type nuclease